MKQPPERWLGLCGVAAWATGLLVVAGVARSPFPGLGAWLGSEELAAFTAWATWGLAGASAVLAWAAQDALSVRFTAVIVAAAIVIEEGETPAAAPSWLSGVSAVAGAAVPGALAWLATAIPGSLDASPARRPAAAGCPMRLVLSLTAVVSLAAGAVSAMLVDPSLHGCSACTSRTWVIADEPGAADALARFSAAVAVLACVATAAFIRFGLVDRGRSRSVASRTASVGAPPHGTRDSSELLVGPREWVAVMAVGCSLFLFAWPRFSGALMTAVGPARTVAAAGLLVLGSALVAPRLLAWRRRANLVRAVTRAATGGGLSAPWDIQGALRGAMRDPHLLLAYPIEAGVLVDAQGMPVAVSGLTTTAVNRGGVPLAVLAMRPGRAYNHAQADLALALAAPVIEVEREAAGLSVRRRVLLKARSASVAAADRERRQLEQDLHDEAQQRLVSIMMRLRVEANHSRAPAVLERAIEDLQRALDEVRQISHGALPRVLFEEGLPAALGDLALELPDDYAIVYHQLGTLDEVVKATAYLVVRACCTPVVPPPSGTVVELVRDDDILKIHVQALAVPERELGDVRSRVMALGAEWVRDGSSLEVALICES